MSEQFLDAQAVVDGFRDRHQGALAHQDVHAVLLEFQTGMIVVQVARIESLQEVEDLFRLALLGGGKADSVTYRIEWSPRATQLGIRGGSFAKGCGITERGTVGWSIMLNGVPVCITANHVLSLSVEVRDRSRKGCLRSTDAEVQVDLLEVTPFRPFPYRNSWDLAIGKYSSPEDIEPEIERFGQEAKREYPTELAHDLRKGARCATVGQTPPHCSYAHLRWLGDVDVDFDEVIYRFKSVLGFDSPFAQKGDSGSIVVYDSDNTVVGLVFAKVPPPAEEAKQIVYANPLFMTRWRRVGVSTIRGRDIPAFEGDVPPPELEGRSSRGHSAG